MHVHFVCGLDQGRIVHKHYIDRAGRHGPLLPGRGVVGTLLTDRKLGPSNHWLPAEVAGCRLQGLSRIIVAPAVTGRRRQQRLNRRTAARTLELVRCAQLMDVLDVALGPAATSEHLTSESRVQCGGE